MKWVIKTSNFLVQMNCCAHADHCTGICVLMVGLALACFFLYSLKSILCKRNSPSTEEKLQATGSARLLLVDSVEQELPVYEFESSMIFKAFKVLISLQTRFMIKNTKFRWFIRELFLMAYFQRRSANKGHTYQQDLVHLFGRVGGPNSGHERIQTSSRFLQVIQLGDVVKQEHLVGWRRQ